LCPVKMNRVRYLSILHQSRLKISTGLGHFTLKSCHGPSNLLMRGPCLPPKNRNELVVLLFETLTFQTGPPNFKANRQRRDSSDNWRNSAQKFIHRTIFQAPIGVLSGPQTPYPPKTLLGNLFSD